MEWKTPPPLQVGSEAAFVARFLGRELRYTYAIVEYTHSAAVDALLDAAEAEFATEGFETGSLRKIMRDAGADPGAVHYHFGGREALATAVLDRILAPLNAHRLVTALPHVRFDVMAWRVRWCVFGTVGALLADESAAFDRPADDLIDVLVRALAATIAA
ncbi:MAG: TetR family transcriptional regulator [Acidimicrobiales bacterium]